MSRLLPMNPWRRRARDCEGGALAVLRAASLALVLAAGIAAEAVAGDALVASPAATAPSDAPRAAWLARPAMSSVTPSPDGRRLAWLQAEGPQRALWLQDDGGEARRLLPRTAAAAIAWSADGRWLLLETPRELFALAVDGQGGSGVLASLGGRARTEWLDVDAGQPAAVLLREHEGGPGQSGPDTWRIHRVHVGGARDLLWQDTHRLLDLLPGEHGQPAWLSRVEGEAIVVHRVVEGQAREVLRCTQARRCRLEAIAPGGGAWLRSDLGGDLHQLQRLHPDGRLEPVLADPRGEADLDEVVADPLTRQPRLLAWRSTVESFVAPDPSDATHLAAIRAALPGSPLRLWPGSGKGAPWWIEAIVPGTPARTWFRYEPATRVLQPWRDDAGIDPRTGDPAPAIPPALRAMPRSVQWTASDGRVLHGFLTLPPGRDPASLPLVVHVHGGPWNHVGPGWRVLPMRLAALGYAVFEPNFRGSTGHGRDLLMAAGDDFGNGRVQADIVEGTRAMLARGIGDARRVGITGASFGGYSTLQALTHQGELFRAGVALVPPPDFAWTLRRVLRQPEALSLGQVLPMQAWLRLVGVDVDDAGAMARLQAQSPLANVASMDRPLLMIAGGRDQRVGLAGVIEYAARLRLAGKDASLVVDDTAGHANADALAREAQLFLIEDLFHRTLGGGAPPPADAEMRAWLRTHARVAAPGVSGDGLR